MKNVFPLAIASTVAMGIFVGATAVAATPESSGSSIDRGRYLVKIMGCNDCHTPSYAPSAGAVPEREWLTGDAVGWQGPWGTTYATNLRLQIAQYSEEQWVSYARSFKSRPPMPWFTLHQTDVSDLRAMYRYIQSLGPAGTPAPGYLPPGKNPDGPAVRFPAPPAAQASAAAP